MIAEDEPFCARQAANNAAISGLLRCWARETGVELPENGFWPLYLPSSGTRLRVEVTYRSPAGHHRFGAVMFGSDVEVDAVTLAALLGVEGSAGRGGDPDAAADLVVRVADSQQRVARHLDSRGTEGEVAAATPFLEAEQALVLGHPLHPAPKSRVTLTDNEAARFSPELRGRFPLHWFAADRSIVSSGGNAETKLKEFAPDVPGGMVAIPAHPWQAREVRHRPAVAELLRSGLLRDLGPRGQQWYPTSSVRTLYHPEASVMLKTSLGLPITNSKRENLRKELYRGEEINRLLDAGLSDAISQRWPGFGIVRDPAWVAVDTAEGTESGKGTESGLELVIRSNPFGSDDRALCVAGLLAQRPERGRSALASVIQKLADQTGKSIMDVTRQWCARYFDHVIAAVLWLYREYGLGLEAHQQNTLVVLDHDGWPCGGWYRDNQGYYISEQRVGELERFLPAVGKAGDNRCADEVIDERLGYYIGINNLLGLVGACGAQGLASEKELLNTLHEKLREYADVRLAARLTEDATLRCKANLLTRLDGLDELVGPLETQSVYCDWANPFFGGDA